MPTVRDVEQDQVAALDSGADNHVAKSFGVDKLLARMRAALRRVGSQLDTQSTLFRTGALTVDLAHQRVFVGDEVIYLTPTEYTLLHTLVTHAGKVLTHRMLLRTVWDSASEQGTPTLRVFIT